MQALRHCAEFRRRFADSQETEKHGILDNSPLEELGFGNAGHIFKNQHDVLDDVPEPARRNDAIPLDGGLQSDCSNGLFDHVDRAAQDFGEFLVQSIELAKMVKAASGKMFCELNRQIDFRIDVGLASGDRTGGDRSSRRARLLQQPPHKLLNRMSRA